MDKMKILAVDDNIVNLATIEQELKNFYEVIPVNSGSRAIRFLNKEKADLVLLDIQMALMDGIETLREMRNMENGATVPVIFLTSKKEKETVLAGVNLGIMDYIIKPFDSQDLRDRIEKALKKSGAVMVGEEELYRVILEIQKLIDDKDLKQATKKGEEVLNYRIGEEYSERVRMMVMKMRAEDWETAQRMLQRVIMMLERVVQVPEKQEKKRISVGDMQARLLYILNDLENFKIDEATEKVDDLLRFELPFDISLKCKSAKDCLAEYDDGGAEELIKAAIADIKQYM